MKKTVFLLLIAFFSIALTACESSEEKLERENNEKAALEYACEYIEEKYNFEPKIIKYESDYQQQIFGRQYYPQLLVEMSYDNREFLTYINYDGTNAKDSYQHEDIKEALSSTIDEQISGLKNLSLSARHSINSNSYYHVFRDCLCGTYFDGTNLDEVLNECNAEYVAYYVDKQFPDSEEMQFFGDNIVGSFVSYRSEAAMELLPDVQPIDHFRDVEAAPYVKCMQITNGYHTHFDLKHFDEFEYISFDVSSYDPKIEMTLNRLNKPCELKSISKASPIGNDADSRVEYEDLTAAYTIETDVDTNLFLYFPLEGALYSDDELVLRYSYEDDETGETDISSKSITICGDYAVAYISCGKNTELSFCLAHKDIPKQTAE